MRRKVLYFIALSAAVFAGYMLLRFNGRFFPPEKAINIVNQSVSSSSEATKNTDLPVIIDRAGLAANYKDWPIYGDKSNNFSIKYPKGWHVIKHVKSREEILYGYPDVVYFSTSPSGNATNDGNWARITLSIYGKDRDESINEWLDNMSKSPAPGYDAEYEKVRVGELDYFGSKNFKLVSWKNAYVELPNGKVMKISLENKALRLISEYSKLYYSMLSTLAMLK